MEKEFENKRYTTIIRKREVFNFITGKRSKYPDQYFVYDNEKEHEISIPNFYPTSYEDIRNKAIELNNAI